MANIVNYFIEADFLNNRNPITNKIANVATEIFTLPVILTVIPISIVPIKEAPLPQISYKPKYSPELSAGMIDA